MQLTASNLKAVMKTETKNGAVAYETTGKDILDFNFQISRYRNASEKEIKNDFAKVFAEDNILALKYLFYAGDIREGIGERKVFSTGMKWLCEEKPEIANKLIKLIPEYSRWDVLVKLDNPVAHKIVAEQLTEDIDNMQNHKAISLLAKWMPSINTSSKETRELAKHYIKVLKLNAKTYRKTLAKLRAYSNVVERKMSDRQWGDINYSAVPSKANLNYSQAFLNHDKERRSQFLQDLVGGKTKINAQVLQPHEIVEKYPYGRYNETYEQLWKNLPEMTTGDMLVVRDGSGSMFGRPLNVATALAVYTAQHNKGEWHNKFITFSSRPQLVDFSHCKSLSDILTYCDGFDDCSNTNLYATFKLILDAAIAAKATLPETITIISDMQFDGRAHSMSKTLMEEIQEEYKEAGYTLPRIVFWNVSNYCSGLVQMHTNELGIVEISGFSVNLLKQVLSNEVDPYKVLLDTLNVPRYNKVIDTLHN